MYLGVLLFPKESGYADVLMRSQVNYKPQQKQMITRIYTVFFRFELCYGECGECCCTAGCAGRHCSAPHGREECARLVHRTVTIQIYIISLHTTVNYSQQVMWNGNTDRLDNVLRRAPLEH